jgi:quercetin dioxygenase-like cupin family protein
MPEPLIVRAPDGAVVQGAPWLFKAVGDQTAGAFDFMVGSVDPFTGPPLHVHDEQTDTFYILEGTLTVQVNDDIIELQPGDFAAVPPGTPHTFDNIYPDRPPVLAINLMTPAGLHSYFAEIQQAGKGADAAALKEIARRHGMRSVGVPLREKLGLA